MTNNKQQTAVEWFIEELEEKGKAYEENQVVRTINICIDVSDYMELKQQANEMEKEQAQHWFKFGMLLVEGHLWKPMDKFEQYYNENHEQNN
jgi:hypothetical protein